MKYMTFFAILFLSAYGVQVFTEDSKTEIEKRLLQEKINLLQSLYPDHCFYFPRQYIDPKTGEIYSLRNISANEKEISHPKCPLLPNCVKLQPNTQLTFITLHYISSKLESTLLFATIKDKTQESLRPLTQESLRHLITDNFCKRITFSSYLRKLFFR